MSKLVKVTAALDADNVTDLTIFDSAGAPVDLDALGATRVYAEVCGQLQNATHDAESFSGNAVAIKFGGLAVDPGTYSPKLVYVSPAKPDGEVLAGPGFETEIRLRLGC